MDLPGPAAARGGPSATRRGVLGPSLVRRVVMGFIRWCFISVAENDKS